MRAMARQGGVRRDVLSSVSDYKKKGIFSSRTDSAIYSYVRAHMQELVRDAEDGHETSSESESSDDEEENDIWICKQSEVCMLHFDEAHKLYKSAPDLLGKVVAGLIAYRNTGLTNGAVGEEALKILGSKSCLKRGSSKQSKRPLQE